MTLTDVIEEIKLELTGKMVELDIEDETLAAIVNKALRELQRYWDEMSFVTVPFASCIDYHGTPLENSSSIVKVYRTHGMGAASDVTAMSDPLLMQQWMVFSNAGTMYNLQDYIMNYAAWTTLSQTKNTLSTDLAFTEDKHDHKLYINSALSAPGYITIQYIPKLHRVEDIRSDYWQDILIRLSTALTKVTIGRIRSKYSLSNALWGIDGEKMLEEGNTDLKELREVLRANSAMIFPID